MDYNLSQNVVLKRVSTDAEHFREKAIGGRLLWKVSGTCLGALCEGLSVSINYVSGSVNAA